MNFKFFMLIILVVAMLVPTSESWWGGRRRRRRRTTPKPAPTPGLSEHCKRQIQKFTNIQGNSLHELAKVWAPAVKLAIGETWKPSSVDFFLKNVKLVGMHNPPADLNASNLPACNRDCYLTTIGRLNCASCTNLPFLHGQENSWPVYTTIETNGNEVKIIYRFFYPYNRGKRVCIGLYFKYCLGAYSTFGHHVGDWEHVYIKFVNGKIHSMYLSIHDSKVTDEFGGEFKWNGKEFRKGNRKIEMQDCTHGVTFSSLGSHGLWPTAGDHTYKKLPNNARLIDKCSRGRAWDTWKYLQITTKKPIGSYTGQFSFMNFVGRWGNRKRSCGIAEDVSGECILNNGPRLSV